MDPTWAPQLANAREAAAAMLDPAATQPRYDRPAVTFGRYQIVSIAHLDTVRTILMDWPTLDIGVIDLADPKPLDLTTIPPHLQEFYHQCEANIHGRSKIHLGRAVAL